nr:hypothetical protein [Moraxella osloensis]
MFRIFKNSSHTDPHNPQVEVDTETGAKKYLKSLSKLSYEDLCKEFSYVMAGKYNAMNMLPFSDYHQRQKTVTDLTDKATLICIYAFGYQKLMNFSNNDLTVVNRLVNQLDDQVAKLDLEPADHGSLLLAKLKDAIF